MNVVEANQSSSDTVSVIMDLSTNVSVHAVINTQSLLLSVFLTSLFSEPFGFSVPHNVLIYN